MEARSIKDTAVFVIGIMVLMLLANDATAQQCTKRANTYEGDLRTISVQDSVSQGSPLTDWNIFFAVDNWSSQSWRCPANVIFHPHIRGSSAAISTYQEAGRSYNVYPTGVRGVGIVLRTHTIVPYDNVAKQVHDATYTTDANFGYHTRYRLIKTEPKVYEGPVSRVQVADTWNRTEGNEQFPIFLAAGTINICYLDCKTADGQINESDTRPPGTKDVRMFPFSEKKVP